MHRISKCSTAKFAAIYLLIIILLTSTAFGAPVGPDKIVNLTTETAPVRSAFKLNTSGGTFTTLRINITATTYRWKAYAGNVTGKFTLDDAKNYTIYDWTISTVAGEVYATRSSTLVSWAGIKCANATTIRTEEIALNISSTSDDSINRTFDKKPFTHNEFYAGAVKISSNSCPSTATYVNSTKQTVRFQEVMLYDASRIVYAGLLENKIKGFNNKYYDFQLILPESGLEGQQAATPYYFYIELT